jgi:hypothetical protein
MHFYVRVLRISIRIRNIAKYKCCGSGSVCFLTSRIRIFHYLYGSGSGIICMALEPDPFVIKQK